SSAPTAGRPRRGPSAAQSPCCPACAEGIAVPGLAARARRPEMMTTTPPTAMSTPPPIRTSPRVFTSWILSLFVGLWAVSGGHTLPPHRDHFLTCHRCTVPVATARPGDDDGDELVIRDPPERGPV